MAVLGCGEATAPEGGSPVPSETSAIAPLLANTWHAAVVRNPAALEAMLDGPGGSGWLALFHGDLPGAETAFAQGLSQVPADPACHLGLARVALARADLLIAARSLARRVGPELAAYRSERADRVRNGRFEPVLAAITLVGHEAAGPQRERAVAAAAGWTPAPDVDPATARAMQDLLARRIEGSTEPPDGLPPDWMGRLRAAHEGSTDGIGDGAAPDVLDRLGADSDTGIAFALSWWDPALADARLAAALHQVASHGLAAGEPGRALAEIASESSGIVLETASAGAPAEAPAGLRELMLFGAPWTDVADLRASWGLAGGHSFLTRLAAVVPEQSLLQGEAGSDIDRVLRYAQALLDQSKVELQGLASEQGRALVRDLELPQKLHDHMLRQRMMRSLEAGEAVRALRLGERSLDVTGSKDGGLTRLSHRNDAGYLVRLAHVHSVGGRPGVARDYVHPLTSRFPALSAVSYTLGQLDAASSIGVQGKTSQQ